MEVKDKMCDLSKCGLNGSLNMREWIIATWVGTYQWGAHYVENKSFCETSGTSGAFLCSPFSFLLHFLLSHLFYCIFSLFSPPSLSQHTHRVSVKFTGPMKGDMQVCVFSCDGRDPRCLLEHDCAPFPSFFGFVSVLCCGNIIIVEDLALQYLNQRF